MAVPDSAEPLSHEVCHNPCVGVSVVVPVYRSSHTLPVLVSRISEQFPHDAFEIILVDDGSNDETWSVIEGIVSESSQIRGLRLGRNSGQHSALLAGVRAATQSIIVTIDDDLQNPPDQIPVLLSTLADERVDVVYGIPREVSQSGWRRLSSGLIRKSMRSVLGVDEVMNMSSFRAFRTDLRNAFSVRIGPGVSLDALLAWSTNRFGVVEVKHDQRSVGESNYSFGKLVRFALDTVTGYTTVPLRLVSGLGFLTALLGLVLMLVFVMWPFIQGISVQGFPFLASTIILFSGIQLITLGVIGEYLARMHFRIMSKPEYVVAEETGFIGDRENGN